MLKTRFILIFVLLGALSLTGQDIHYSQFFNSPLNLNPGLTGAFNGNQRYHMNLRRQWASVPVDFVSGTVGADFKYYQKKGSYFGLGGLINYDQAGDLNLNMTGLNLFVSYALKVSDQIYLMPGIAASYAQRNFDFDNIRSGNQWDGLAYNPLIPAEDIGADNASYFDFSGGLNVRWQSAYRNFLNVGAGFYHAIKPSEGFNPTATYVSERPMRMTVYLSWNQKIASPIDLIISGVYAKQDAYQETVINAQAKLYLGEKQNTALYLGGGYRFDDAWYPMIGLEFGQFYGAFSYDFTISDFNDATDGRGGPELSLRYILAQIPEGTNKACFLY